jgi:hypothetical protein
MVSEENVMNFISVNSDTKVLERQFMRSFQCFCEDFPKGELIGGETPDFFIMTPEGKKIGIEVTQVFKQDGDDVTAEQPNESTKERITEAAQAHAEQLGLPPAHVSLFFNPEHLSLLRRKGKPERRHLTKAEEQTVARNIAEFVGKNTPPDGASVNLEYHLGSGQPRQTDQIIISRYQSPVRHRWSYPEFKGIQHHAIERLEGAISAKTRVHNVCQSKCDECWLLVVAQSFRASATIHPDDQTLSHKYTSPFNRVYFVDMALMSVVLLNTN